MYLIRIIAKTKQGEETLITQQSRETLPLVGDTLILNKHEVKVLQIKHDYRGGIPEGVVDLIVDITETT